MTSPLQFLDDNGRTARRVRPADPLPVTGTVTVVGGDELAREATLEEVRDAILALRFRWIHVQDIAADEWLVTHNLGAFPNVTVTDTAGEEVVADIFYVNSNQVRIVFANPMAGVAYLS